VTDHVTGSTTTAVAAEHLGDALHQLGRIVANPMTAFVPSLRTRKRSLVKVVVVIA